MSLCRRKQESGHIRDAHICQAKVGSVVAGEIALGKDVDVGKLNFEHSRK